MVTIFMITNTWYSGTLKTMERIKGSYREQIGCFYGCCLFCSYLHPLRIAFDWWCIRGFILLLQGSQSMCQGDLIPWNGEWYLETMVWVLGVLTSTGGVTASRFSQQTELGSRLWMITHPSIHTYLYSFLTVSYIFLKIPMHFVGNSNSDSASQDSVFPSLLSIFVIFLSDRNMAIICNIFTYLFSPTTHIK